MELEVKDPEKLVIAVTGFAATLMIPEKQFLYFSGLAGYSRIILRDPSRLMFFQGIKGKYESFPELVEGLAAQIRKLGPKWLVVTGTSGGAHTALLLGHLLKADMATAFSPFPYIDKKTLRAQRDPALRVYAAIANRLDELPKETKRYYNLKDALAKWNGKTEYFVHVAREARWDRRRAEYLEGLPHLTVIRHPSNTHYVAKKLGMSHMLHKCFDPEQRRTFDDFYQGLPLVGSKRERAQEQGSAFARNPLRAPGTE
jgi:hypothetical protein